MFAFGETMTTIQLLSGCSAGALFYVHPFVHLPLFFDRHADFNVVSPQQHPCHHNSQNNRIIPRRAHLHRLGPIFGSTPSVPHTSADLEDLTRRELQALCKKLNLRAIGKTTELRTRLSEALALPSAANPLPQDSLRPHTNDVIPLKPSSSRRPRGRSIGDVKTETNIGGASIIDEVNVGAGCTTSPTGEDPREVAHLHEPTGSVELDFKLVHDIPVSLDRLSNEQREKIVQLGLLLVEWNEKINLVSRKDIRNVLQRHLLPCVEMALALDIEDGMTGERRKVLNCLGIDSSSVACCRIW